MPAAAIVDQHQPLALDILEGKRQPAVDLGDLACRNTGVRQPVAPERQRFFAGHAQAGAR